VTEAPDAATSADEDYWTDVFRTHQRAMRVAAITRLGQNKSHLGHTSESVVQEVMRRLIKKGEVIRAAKPEAYLVAAVKNLTTDILRQEGRRPRDRLAAEDQTEDSWEEPSVEDVAEAATDAIIRDRTRKVLETMEEGIRQAFVEHVMKGRPLTEIGRAMGISDVQAGRLYRQAVREIQNKLGVDPARPSRR